MESDGLHISRTDRNRGRPCTERRGYNRTLQQARVMPHLVTNPNNLLLAAITTGGVLHEWAMPDDKSLRVGDLDKAVWVLLRCDSLKQVSIVTEKKICVHSRKATCACIIIRAVQAFLEQRE